MTHGCADVPAMHKDAHLEPQATAAAALEESDLEVLERHILEREYNLEVLEEPDILELAHISEPELRDSLEMEELGILESAYTSEPELLDFLEQEFNLEQEEVELRDSGRRMGLVDTSEPEVQESGSPQSHELGISRP